MKVFSSSLFVLTLAISPVFAASVSITTKTLPNGTLQTPYHASINTSNGCTPFKWAIVSGKLPPGISMKVSRTTTSLSLTGTPSSTATSTFTVSVTACGGHISKQAYTVKIQRGANHVVGLSWNPSTSKNIGGYNVYRSPDSKSWSKINPSVIASTIYDDSSVSNGSTYYYSATAVDISGKESAKTPSVKVNVP